MKKKLFFLSLLFFLQSIKAQNGYYFVKTFQSELYKETNSIGKFEKASNGVIFCSHSNGIVALDGKNWWEIPSDKSVYDLKIIQNQIFYLTDNYLGNIANLNQLPYQTSKFLDLKSKFSQMEYISPYLFLYSEEEILSIHLEQKTQKSIKSPSGGFFGGMLRHQNSLWILEPSLGFLTVNLKNFELEPIQNSEIFENQYLQNYYSTSEALYLVTIDNAIYVYENQDFKLLGQYNSAKNTFIHGLTVVEEEVIAATNNQGLLVINKKNGSIVQQISTIHGLPDNESHSIFLDDKQGVWLAHPFHFSRIYWSKKFEDYTNAVGLIGNIHCLAKNQEQIWVGTDNGLFYLTYEIPKESEMISFTVSKTVIKQDKSTKNYHSQNNPLENQQQEVKEKKGIFKKLKDKFSKKDKNTKEEKSSEKGKEKEEKKQNVIQEQKYTYQENISQVNIKSAENYRKYLVFRPIAGISELVYDIKVFQNKVYVGTQKGFYEIVNQKIEFKLPILTYKILEKSGFVWVASNQKILKLEKKGKLWETSKSIHVGRFVNSLVIKGNDILGGTTKGYFKVTEDLQNLQWFLENQGNIYLQSYQNQVYALSSQKIYKHGREPILLNLFIPNHYQIIPSSEGLFLLSKSLILALNDNSSWDTLYYSRLLDDVPSFIYENNHQYLLSGKKSLLKFYKESTQSSTQVYVRGFSITGKSFWGTVYKDSLIYDTNLELAYGDYNIQVKLSTSNLFEPTAVQYFVSINNGEWALIESKDWILYNLPAGNYTIGLKAILPNGEMTEIYNFYIQIAPPFWKSWWFYLLLIGLFIASAYYYTRFKLKQLELEKKKIEEENQILEQKVEERTREIAEQKKIIEEKNEEIMDSLRYSERIQQAMLPKEQQIRSIFENNCFVLYMPRDVVSGDFYWVYEKNEQLLIAAGDCTGHGVPGALMSMIGISMLNKIVDSGIYEPSKILSALHKEIHESLKQGSDNQVLDGMDIALVLFEPQKHKITFSSAMRPIYFIRDQELIIYKGDKKPIGGREPEKFFSSHEMFLEDGDIFYLFSDGYADQFNPDNQKYQLGRFRKKLLDIHQEPLKKQQEILKQEILDWKGNMDQVDDIMVIGIKYRK